MKANNELFDLLREALEAVESWGTHDHEETLRDLTRFLNRHGYGNADQWMIMEVVESSQVYDVIKVTCPSPRIYKGRSEEEREMDNLLDNYLHRTPDDDRMRDRANDDYEGRLDRVLADGWEPIGISLGTQEQGVNGYRMRVYVFRRRLG